MPCLYEHNRSGCFPIGTPAFLPGCSPVTPFHCAVLAIALCIAAAKPAVAQDKPIVEVAGFSLAKKDPKSEFNQSFSQFQSPGTSVDLFVMLPGQTVLSLDSKNTKLTLASDEGSELPLRDQFDGPVQLRLREDKSSGILQLQSDELPGRKCTQLNVEGVCALVTGKEPKTEDVVVKLVTGTKIKLGAMEATVGEIGEAFGDPFKQSLELSSSSSFDTIAKVEFVDASGKVIESGGGGSGSFGFGGDVTYSQSWQVASDAKQLTMRVTTFTKTETVKLPVKLQFGLGF